jgi:integrase/recombinase XerD
MAQAKTLNEKEIKRMLNFISLRRHAERDRAMFLLTHLAGMRIGEVANLKIRDVLAADGTIREEIRLTAEQTKGKHSRTVTLSEKMRKELGKYVDYRFDEATRLALTNADTDKPLFNTQKRAGFSPNTLCHHFFMLYREAGLDGASSHSGRRSFLTSLSQKSVPLKVLMELAGHRQAQTTMRYVSVTTDMKKAAVELI